MKISIVIPSLNQGEYIEETLRSVIDQADVEREIIVIDGGSNDGTLDTLRRYSDQLAYWESNPDTGQSHAINKGLERATGDVWMFLNSDDLLAPGALGRVARYFEDPSVEWVSGYSETFDATGIIGAIRPAAPRRSKDYLAPWNSGGLNYFPFSGSCFMRRELVKRIGLFDESYHYSMDIEYYCRALFEGGAKQTIVPDVLAEWRWHEASKTVSRGVAFEFRREEIRIADMYRNHLSAAEQEELSAELAIEKKGLVAREAMWLLRQGQRRKALSLLIGSAAATRGLLLFRPWQGAFRRAVLGR